MLIDLTEMSYGWKFLYPPQKKAKLPNQAHSIVPIFSKNSLIFSASFSPLNSCIHTPWSLKHGCNLKQFSEMDLSEAADEVIIA